MAFVPKTTVISTGTSTVSSSLKFDASAQTIEILDSNFRELIYATNVTDGIVIFDPAIPSKTGTKKDRITSLVFDTTAMNDNDQILAIIEPIVRIDFTQDSILNEILASLNKIKIHMSLITGFETE